MMRFGERLRQHRKAKGVSSRSLELKQGLDRSSLRQIELGTRPASEADIDKLLSCEALGLTREVLTAWQRLDSASTGEIVEILKTLASERELLNLINQTLEEKGQ